MTIKLRELSPEEMLDLYPFLQQLNPDMTKRDFAALMKEQIKQGFRCVGAFEGKKCMGISGFWIGHKFYARKHLHIDAFVVDESARSKGIGKKLIDWLEALAAKEKCNMVVMDTYVSNTASHKFYHREGYVIAGYHFLKRI